MAAWRRKAHALFPDLRRRMPGVRWTTIYDLFFVVLPLSRDALRSGDDDLLRRIYGFAAWCFAQPSKGLWNAAAVAFYEHQFDEWELRRSVLPWLPPNVIQNCWPLWEFRLNEEKLAELRELVNEPRSERWRELAV